MPRFISMRALLLTLALALPAAAQTTVVQPMSPPAADKPKEPAKIEFRWLEEVAIEGVTDAKGIINSCGGEPKFPRLKPVLTNADIASAKATHVEFAMSDIPGENHTIDFEFTKDARAKLVEDLGNDSGRELAVFIDGKYWGTGFFKKSEAATYKQIAGFIPTKAETERILAAVK